MDDKKQNNETTESDNIDQINVLSDNKNGDQINIDQEVVISNGFKDDVNTKNSSDFDDKETDGIVEDIIKEESDVLIGAHDEKISQYNLPPKKSNIFKRFFAGWWHNKFARWFTILLVVGGISALFIIPSTRYSILNKLGVRATMSVQVVDAKSGRPVKNVSASLQGQQKQSDENGNVSFQDLYLGAFELSLSKRSFSSENVPVVIGWGSNPYSSPIEINPTGTVFKFTLTDWLSNSPINKATISDGESEAFTNDKGEAELTIEPTDNDIVITVSADLYRPNSITIPANSDAPQQVQLVPSKKDIFLSNRSGKLSVYSRNLDNTDETVLFAGTGNEQDSTQLAPHSSKDFAVLASSRDGKRDSRGNILSALYVINADNKKVEQINDSTSSNVRLIGWSDDSIVYVLGSGATIESPTDQQKLVAYNTATEQVKELAKSSYFGDVKIANSNVYYVTSSFDQAQTGAGLNYIDVDGSGQKVLIDKPIWSVSRSDQSKIIVNAQEDTWFQININNNEVKSLEGRPPQFKDYYYVLSPFDSKVGYVDVRDGKGALLIINSHEQDKTAQEITRQSGLIPSPIRWINPGLVLYTINTPQESANYVVDLQTKQIKKIGDITIYEPSAYR